MTIVSNAVQAIFLLTCATFIDDCAGQQRRGDDASISSTSSHSSSSGASWTYRRTATDGGEPYCPSDWYKGYPDCGSNAQSPINLAANTQTVVKPRHYDLEFFPHVCTSDKLAFVASERVWEAVFDGCSEEAYLNFNGERYNLIQIHIHSPSEHAIGGSLYGAEIHWVHLKEGTEDELLVVGVFFDVREYGSIVEGVTWIVMNEPVIIGKMQLEAFRTSVALYDDSKVDELGNTNRPYQPLNDRDVYFVKA